MMNINIIIPFTLSGKWEISSRKEVVLCISDCLTLKHMRYAA